MKRDMELIRAMLLALESEPTGGVTYDALAKHFPDHDRQTVSFHLTLLGDAGLVDQEKVYFRERKVARGGFYITWEGYEFLETIRDAEIWRKTKEGASKVGSWSVSLIAEIGKAFISAKARELGLMG